MPPRKRKAPVRKKKKAAEEPVVEEPAAEETAVEEPAVEDAVAEAPAEVVEEPKADEVTETSAEAVEEVKVDASDDAVTNGAVESNGAEAVEADSTSAEVTSDVVLEQALADNDITLDGGEKEETKVVSTEMSFEDKKKARAARFGVPLNTSPQAKVAARGERFGTAQKRSSDGMNDEQKRKKRADRFVEAAKPAVSEEEALKMQKRKERFNTPPTETDKAKAREERFATTTE